MENQDENTEQYPELEIRWFDPQEIEKSRLYDDDPNRGDRQLQQSIVSLGVQLPLLGRIEDGKPVVFEGGRRLDAAEVADEEVPVWVPKVGNWTDARVKFARLLTNTTAFDEQTDWLRRAWLIEDWWDEAGSTQVPAVLEVSDTLGITQSKASRWVEPVRQRWNNTIIDRKMFDGEQIFQPESSTNELINGLHINEVIENVNPLRLQDINAIVSESAHRGSDHRLRVKLLNGYVRGDISYDELKQLKSRVDDESIPAEQALNEIRDNEDGIVEAELEGEVAEKLTILSNQTGKDPTEIIEEAAEKVVQEEQIELDPQKEASDEYIGQFSYLDGRVDEPFPKPDLRMESNERMAELPANSVELTVTSPPYNVAWDYGDMTTDNRNYGEYLELIQESFSEVYRLTVPGGYCCIVVPHIVDVDNEEMQTPAGTPIAADVIDVLTDVGWTLFDLITWDKGYNEAGLRDQEFPHPESKLNNFSEAIIVLKKPGEREVGRERREQSKIIRNDSVSDRDLRDNVWHISPTMWEPQYTEVSDTAQFPEELAKRCILHWSYVGDTVLDPYAGRGTTLKMAKQLYRESIGYEIQTELEQDIKRYVGID